MKIRTDFVTNSSSSSFIGITVQTKTKEKALAGGFESGNVEIDYDLSTFPITEKDLQEMKDMKQLVARMSKWLFDNLEDPECGSDEEDFVKYYGFGDIAKIAALDMDKVRKLSFYSGTEEYDEPCGYLLTDYDFETNQLVEFFDFEGMYDNEVRIIDIYNNRKSQYWYNHEPTFPERHVHEEDEEE